MRHSSLAALALAVACSGSLSAQSADRRIGRQFRVSAPAQRIYAKTLTLFEATPDTLVLGYVVLRPEGGAWRPDTTRMRVAVANVSRFEVRAWRSNIEKGAAIGAVSGALAAFLIYKAGESSSCGWLDYFCWKPGHAGQTALIGGGVGLVIGALAGALSSRQGWVSVPVAGVRGPQLGLGPQNGRSLGVGVAVSF